MYTCTKNYFSFYKYKFEGIMAVKTKHTIRHIKNQLSKSIVPQGKKSVRHHKAFSKTKKRGRITCLKCKRVLKNRSRKRFGRGLIACRDLRRLKTHCSSCRHSCGGVKKEITETRPNFVFFSDLEGNSNVNRFNHGRELANLNYLQELLDKHKHEEKKTQYIFGGDAWDFGNTVPTNAKDNLSSLHAIKKLQEIDTWHVLGNRDLNKLFIPFWLVLLKDDTHVLNAKNFGGIWDSDYEARTECPNNLRAAIDHILQKMQGVGPIYKGFDNYDEQMPELKYNTQDKPPSLYTYIVETLYKEEHDTQPALFLRHLMYEEGVMYKWIKSGHIVLDFKWNDQLFVVSHGCLPTKHNMRYYDELHQKGFEQYKYEINHQLTTTSSPMLHERCSFIMQYAAMANRNEQLNNIHKNKTNNYLALVELVVLSFSNNDSESPVNSSFIGDQDKITENVQKFIRMNKATEKLVVLHGHRNYSIDTALKYVINENTTVLYYDTSSWRRKSKTPTSLWGKHDMKEVYVDSAILERPISLDVYKTTYNVKKNEFTLMDQKYTREDEREPFSVVAS